MRAVLTNLMLLLLLGGVAAIAAEPVTTQPVSIADERAEAALQRAREHYRAGKLNEAAGLLRGFVVSQPNSPLVNTAFLQLAQIHAELGEPKPALGYLGQLPLEAWTPASQLLQARLLVDTGDTNRATQQLLNLDQGDLSLGQRQERWLILSEAALRLEQPQQALFFLYQALLTEGAETPDEIMARARTVMGNHLSSLDLQEVSFMYAETPFAAMATLHLAWQALAAGNKTLAMQHAEAVLTSPAGRSFRDEALTLLAPLTDPSQVQRAIGVLLPLSGRYAAFGERVQRGMQMAQESFRPPIPVRFIYRDTAGDADQAAQQLADLSIRERVLGIAGPLVGAAASAAAIRANGERLPMLTLSQKEGLAGSSQYVFRNSLTPELQVRALVTAAIQDLAIQQFGMLTPQTRQGELFAELFAEEVLRQGGLLVAAESYTSEQTDFRREVRLLRGLDPNAPDEEEEVPVDGDPVEEEPPPFQALFVPDYADRISLIAPQIAFYGLEGVQLLGTNGWNDPELLRQARGFIEGAIFTDGFFRHSNYPFVQDFAERYFTRYGEEPTILEAQGYDIAGILLNLFSRYDIRSRENLRREISQLQNYPGVTGSTRFDYLGEADKVLFLLQIKDGAIEQIN